MTSTDPFDFSGAGSPLPAPSAVTGAGPAGAGVTGVGLTDATSTNAVPTNAVPVGPGPADTGIPARATPRGRRLAQACLVTATLASAAAGGGIAAALTAIDVTSLDPLGRTLGWVAVALLGAVTVPVALVLGIVAVVRARSTLTVVALTVAMVAPPAAFVIGVNHGITVLHHRVADAWEGGAGAALDSLDESLAGWGVATGPLRAWLEDDARER